MADRPIDRDKCRILISNDDGIASPGIKLLEKIARGLSNDVWVVAPELEQSGASHSLTTRRPLRLQEVGRQRYSVDGTPTDCVLLAVKRLLRDHPPDLVLSGINGGSNVGEDLTYSGTVAAAMEATLLGIPAMALSQDYRNGRDIPWQTSETFAPEVIRRLLRLPWRSEEHTSELQSLAYLVCRLLLEKKKKQPMSYLTEIIKYDILRKKKDNQNN